MRDHVTIFFVMNDNLLWILGTNRANQFVDDSTVHPEV